MSHSSLIMVPALTATSTPALDRRPVAPQYRNVADLTQGLAAGNEEAFRLFHENYFNRLFRLALVLTRGHHAAATEVVQEALCRVARYARRFDREEVFWCWLVAVTRSAAQDYTRKRRRYLALVEDYVLRWLPVQPSAPAEPERRLEELLQECLAELQESDRALVEGKYLGGLTVRELAQRTRLTEKAVESRLGRLRQQLRGRLLARLREDER